MNTQEKLELFAIVSFKITSFVVSQGCVILETLDKRPFPIELWEGDDDYEKDSTVKVKIYSDSICWHPRGVENGKLIEK